MCFTIITAALAVVLSDMPLKNKNNFSRQAAYKIDICDWQSLYVNNIPKSF